MSRLTSNQYIAQHQTLRYLWLARDGRAYGRMSVADQRVIHDFYRPSEQLSDVDLLQHRQQVSVTDKSLANRAGKVYARFMRGEVGKEAASAIYRGKVLSAHPVLRPQLSTKLLAKILVRIASDEVKMRRDQNKSDNQDDLG